MVDSKITKISDSHFVWEMTDFLYFRRTNHYCRSPRFVYNGRLYYLQWFERIRESDDLIRFRMQFFENVSREVTVMSDTEIYRICIKNGKGDDYWTSPLLTIRFFNDIFGDQQLHIPKSDFNTNEFLLAPFGVLSLHLTFYSPTIGTPPPQDKTILTKVITADVGIQTCPELQSKQNFSCSSDGRDKVLLHFKELLLNGKKSDVTFRVKGKEFKAHKAILTARSPVFDKMFDHEMVEQTTGSVEITDCEPEDFHLFLLYLYTGEVEEPTVERAVELYCLGDKYNIEELIPYCIQFLLSNMSVEYFCDIVSLGLRLCETELMSSASIFFAKHMKQIIRTDKWKSFIIKNPAEANELFIKGLS